MFVSPIWKFKNHETVIKALANLRAQGFDFNCKFVGDDRAEPRHTKALKSMIEQYGLIDRIFFLGTVPHESVLTLLESSDIFLFASLCENMPNTLIEAMSLQLPILCANAGPMPEVLAESALLFRATDPEDLAAELERLLSNKNLRRQLALKAKNRAMEFHWDRTAKETLKYLQDVENKMEKL